MNEKNKIFLLFIFLFGGLLFIPFDTYASEMYWQPYDIVIQQPGGNNVVISANRYNLNNLDYWSFPPNQSSDFATPASIYFRYNNGNNDYCIYQANNGSVSGQFYAANAFTANHGVRVQDRSVSSRPYFNCNSTLNSNTHYLEFTCNNLNLSHNYNFIITNANAQRYGIRANVNVECQQTIEGATSAITGAINEQTQVDRDIKNNTKETNDLIKNDNVSESNTTISNFFNNFNSGNNGGLTDIISLPLDFLNSLNNTCQPINISIPYFNTNFTIPCLSTIYSQVLDSSLLNLIRLIINGLIMYRCIGSLVIFINDLRDPNNADLEVMDL